MSTSQIAHLQNAVNFRDASSVIYQSATYDAESLPLPTGRLFRCGMILSSPEELNSFVEAITRPLCVIDLRTGWEREDYPEPEFPGIEFLHIPLYDLEKVGLEYTKSDLPVDERGHIFMLDNRNFYRELLNPVTLAQIAENVRVVYQRLAHGAAVIVHCTNGKDRTGIVVGCLLYALGLPFDAVLADYVESDLHLPDHSDHIYAKCLKHGGTVEQAEYSRAMHRALPEYAQIIVDTIRNNWGSFEKFAAQGLGIKRLPLPPID